jgi:hypothetical protein
MIDGPKDVDLDGSSHPVDLEYPQNLDDVLSIVTRLWSVAKNQYFT